MSSLRSNVGYLGMGVGVTISLWFILAFFPTIMVSLSIVDTFYDWQSYSTTPDGNPYVHCNDTIFASACFTFCIILIILGFIQVGLIANIRKTWGIVVPWFLLSIHPFIYWVCWLFNPDSNVLYAGVNWMPW